ncbi:MAG: PepSY-associated TM helix domain-containing protein [Parvibaculum sp.]|uniref:PepSY-associated TM helix domain-containing protein n=1 Tax=Parvibaculum sp. TaxID=2024848 RepID=UPI003C7942BB
MVTPDRRNLRHFWRSLHLWIGVGLGLPLILLGLTGSILVWHDDIERLAHPARHAVSAGPADMQPSAYLDAARAALPAGLKPTALRLPGEPGNPVTVTARGANPEGGLPLTMTVYLDPPTASILDVADQGGSFMTLMHRLHGSLMIPGKGRQIVGWLGVAMLISSLTGLYLWWPRNGTLLKALRWRRQPTTNGNLHYTLGFWISLPLAILSFTGAYISFPQTARSVVGLFAEVSPQPQRGPGGPGALPAPVTRTPEEVIGAALAAMPDARLSALIFPSGPNPAWRVQLALGGETRTVTFDDRSGELRGGNARPGASAASGDRFSRLMRQLHDGTEMGLAWQAVIFAGGILPAVLAVTGTLMWLRRRKQASELERKLAEVPAS